MVFGYTFYSVENVLCNQTTYKPHTTYKPQTKATYLLCFYQEPIKGEGASNLAYIRGLRFVIAGETAIPYMGYD